jgi:REP element-mobilizing transposase RayT
MLRAIMHHDEPLAENAARPRGWRSRGRLPHADFAGMTQAITFRLADALPMAVLSQWEQSAEYLAEPIPARRRAFLQARVQQWLDGGAGSCVLGRDGVWQKLAEELQRHDEIRYRLDAFVIMPNHVHVLIGMKGMSLGPILKTWKGASARTINQMLGRDGQLWAREYFDRFIRDERHFLNALAYLVRNPVVAGLVAQPRQWPGLWVREELWSVIAPTEVGGPPAD